MSVPRRTSQKQVSRTRTSSGSVGKPTKKTVSSTRGSTSAVAKRSTPTRSSGTHASLKHIPLSSSSSTNRRNNGSSDVVPSSSSGSPVLFEAIKQYGIAAGSKVLLRMEARAAKLALKTGVYGVWRNRHGNDCTRIGFRSRCMCGHSYKAHEQQSLASLKRSYEGKTSCQENDCHCAGFTFVPQRPEEVGEWWLPRRKDFKVAEWKLLCQCKHSHDVHHQTSTKDYSCFECGCAQFHARAQCVACDSMVGEHTTVWETAEERKAQQRPIGPCYEPLFEAPDAVRAAVGLPAKQQTGGPDVWDEYSVPMVSSHKSEGDVLQQLHSLSRR